MSAALMMPERGVVEGTVAVPLHPDGFAWSEEQDFILRSVETAILGDDRPTLCRFVVEAVAGSGKTTLLEAMLLLIGRLRPHWRVAATAFN